MGLSFKVYVGESTNTRKEDKETLFESGDNLGKCLLNEESSKPLQSCCGRWLVSNHVRSCLLVPQLYFMTFSDLFLFHLASCAQMRLPVSVQSIEESCFDEVVTFCRFKLYKCADCCYFRTVKVSGLDECQVLYQNSNTDVFSVPTEHVFVGQFHEKVSTV